MDAIQMKRITMFTWLDKAEIEWLLIIDELETKKEELEIADVVEGLDRLLMTVERMEQRDRALLGLEEEGLIKMDAELLGNLDIAELSITQRGRKVIAEAKRILEESEPELSSVDRKLMETEKKERQKEKVIGFVMDFAVSAATTIFERMFFGK